MSDGFLSQEEIDALLRNEATGAPSNVSNDSILSDVERDALGEIGNISMGSAATTLSVLLQRRVQITTPRVSVGKLTDMRTEYPMPYVIVEVRFTQGILGTNLLAIRERDGAVIGDLMMGNDGTNPPDQLTDLYLSAVSEAMNQMMGATATSLSNMFKNRVDLAPPKSTVIDLAQTDIFTETVKPDDMVVRISFRMEVDGLIDSEIMLILPLQVARDMVDHLLHADSPPVAPSRASIPPQVSAPPAHSPPPSSPQVPQTQPAVPINQVQQPQQSYQQSHNTPAYQTPDQNFVVQPAQFAPLRASNVNVSDSNIGMIMDVPLQITVELGRTKKLIREILELAPGSVVELDKLAGEPVDILVNGKIVAKGEVVVIDEHFGVRITSIVSMQERANTLQ